MPTTFYFPETEVAAVSPAISAEWEEVNTLRRRALTTPDASTLTTTAYTPDAADHLVDGDAHHRQYVSDGLEAQTIPAQGISGQFQCLEANAGNNLTITIKVFVCGGDGTVKETIFAISRDGTEANTAVRNLTWAGGTTSEVTVEGGDRIVFEIGLGGTPTAAGGVQGHNGSIRFGCDASSGNLPVDDAQTGTTYRPWITFATTTLQLKLDTAFNNYLFVRTPDGISTTEKIR